MEMLSAYELVRIRLCVLFSGQCHVVGGGGGGHGRKYEKNNQQQLE